MLEAADRPIDAAREIVRVVDPLLRTMCMIGSLFLRLSTIEVPSVYYESIQPSQEIVELAASLDIPAVLGQIMLFFLVWSCTRVELSL